MKRARPAPPPVDYRTDRNKWAGLVALTHAAVSSGSAADLKALAERALAAETCWTMLAPFPSGLVCRVLSRLAWAYARQGDEGLAAQLAPMLVASAGLVDELFQRTDLPPPDAVSAPVAAPAPGALRLPYADA